MNIISENDSLVAGKGFFINHFPKALILINTAAIITGLLYLLFNLTFLWQNLTGALTIAAWSGNLILVFLNSRNIPESVAESSPLGKITTFYPVFKIFAMVFIAAAVFSISASYS